MPGLEILEAGPAGGRAEGSFADPVHESSSFGIGSGTVVAPVDCLFELGLIMGKYPLCPGAFWQRNPMHQEKWPEHCWPT